MLISKWRLQEIMNISFFTFYVWSTSYLKQRLAQSKSIRELYLHQGVRKRTPKSIVKTKATTTKSMELWTSCFHGLPEAHIIAHSSWKKHFLKLNFGILGFDHQVYLWEQTSFNKQATIILSNIKVDMKWKFLFYDMIVQAKLERRLLTVSWYLFWFQRYRHSKKFKIAPKVVHLL